MTAERRYLNLNAYLRNSGYHEAAWRVSPADPASVLDPRHYIELARTAERGVLDSIFLPDSPGVAEFRSEYLPGAGLRPAAVAVVGGHRDRAGRADRHCVHHLQLPVGRGPAGGHAGLPQPRAGRVEHRHHRRARRRGQLRRPAASPGGGPV